ncbi:MAG: VWA domain-containing protein [Candidatus Hydrogenedentota bacterium]|nr:MAG: VWA domain-containing protein [Candidatus Hydrogenedentota bacterium]
MVRRLLLCFFVISFVYAEKPVRILHIDPAQFPKIKLEVSIAKVLPLVGITKDSISVRENGWPVREFTFEPTQKYISPRFITLLVDASKSLSEKDFKQQQKAIREFISKLNRDDSLSVTAFEDKVTRVCDFTKSKEKLISCIEKIKRNGSKTLLHDALYESIAHAAKVQKLRSAIVVFTDGHDEGSVMTAEDILRELNRFPVPVFVVGTGHKKKLKKMIRISMASGGKVYHTAQSEEFSKILSLINEILQKTYLVEYESLADSTGKVLKRSHKILSSVTVTVNYDGVSGQDSASFSLPVQDKASFVANKLFSDERYLLYIVGAFFLLLLFILITLLAKKPKVNVEVNAPEIKAPLVMPEEEPVLKKSFPEKKRWFDREAPPLGYFHGYLVEKEGPHTGRKYKLVWDTVNIGYSDENSIVLEDPTVSAVHARIVRTKNGFILYDMLSENGVYLNGKKLLRPKKLNDFDEIQLGRTKLIFRRATGIDLN